MRKVWPARDLVCESAARGHDLVEDGVVGIERALSQECHGASIQADRTRESSRA